MKKIFLWLWILTRRQLRKPAFLVILALLPLLTLLYTAAARQDSGMVTIALALEDPSDPLSSRLVQELTADSPLIRFLLCDPEQAQQEVVSGKVDAAWIFPADLAETMSHFLSQPDQPAVLVVQRQETTALRLSREVLSGALFRSCAEEVYLSYIRQNAPGLAEVSERELLVWYEGIAGNENLFHFQTPEGNASGQPAGYLLSPLRGLLGILISLCGMASALYFRQDLNKGTFSRIPFRKLPLMELCCHIPPLTAMALVALVCLMASGTGTALGRELPVTVLYCLCTAGFSMALSRLWGSEQLLCGMMGALTVAMLAACPVFFQLTALQYLFPPTYYILAVHSNGAFLGMLLYTFLCFLICIPFSSQ